MIGAPAVSLPLGLPLDRFCSYRAVYRSSSGHASGGKPRYMRTTILPDGKAQGSDWKIKMNRGTRAGPGLGERLLEEAMQEREARTAGCCEVDEGCCALRILEAQPDSAAEQSLLETAVLGYILPQVPPRAQP